MFPIQIDERSKTSDKAPTGFETPHLESSITKENVNTIDEVRIDSLADEDANPTATSLSHSSQNKDSGEGSPAADDDDFKCRICNKCFSSDDEVQSHFSEEHFRVGTSDNLLEPPSPFPTPTHTEIEERLDLCVPEFNLEQLLATHSTTRNMDSSPSTDSIMYSANSQQQEIHPMQRIQNMMHSGARQVNSSSDMNSLSIHPGI